VITVVQKSDLSIKKRNAKAALIITGGAITGGAYEVGGLKAFNDLLVNRDVTDFDIYIGLSAGAFLAAPLACGLTPEELLRSLDGKSDVLTQLSIFDLYRLNWQEMFLKPLGYLYDLITAAPRIALDFLMSAISADTNLAGAIWDFIRRPGYRSLDRLMQMIASMVMVSSSLPSLLETIPSGIFDNSRIERYYRMNFRRNGWKNTFVDIYNRRKKALYISAINLDLGERVVFGYDENGSLLVSEAIQASTALPIFYKPARIRGVDYVDGGVYGCSGLDIAVKHGASLIVWYNPFSPIRNEVVVRYIKELDEYVTDKRLLAERGLLIVLNQVFRTLLHTRLHAEIKHYEENIDFMGDIILIEPKPWDYGFFRMNPLAFWERVKAAEYGFASVKDDIERDYSIIKKVLSSYGFETTMLYLQQNAEKIEKSEGESSLDILSREKLKKEIKVLF